LRRGVASPRGLLAVVGSALWRAAAGAVAGEDAASAPDLVGAVADDVAQLEAEAQVTVHVRGQAASPSWPCVGAGGARALVAPPARL
jgi:hypothetical protein